MNYLNGVIIILKFISGIIVAFWGFITFRTIDKDDKLSRNVQYINQIIILILILAYLHYLKVSIF